MKLNINRENKKLINKRIVEQTVLMVIILLAVFISFVIQKSNFFTTFLSEIGTSVFIYIIFNLLITIQYLKLLRYSFCYIFLSCLILVSLPTFFEVKLGNLLGLTIAQLFGLIEFDVLFAILIILILFAIKYLIILFVLALVFKKFEKRRKA